MMNEICVMSNNEKISPLLKGKILKYEEIEICVMSNNEKISPLLKEKILK